MGKQTINVIIMERNRGNTKTDYYRMYTVMLHIVFVKYFNAFRIFLS